VMILRVGALRSASTHLQSCPSTAPIPCIRDLHLLILFTSNKMMCKSLKVLFCPRVQTRN
jgi:hypothetical protein